MTHTSTARMKTSVSALLLLLALVACQGQQPTSRQDSATAISASTPAAVAATATEGAPPATVAASTPPATRPTLGPNMFANPVIDQDFPDPDALKVGDTYYVYATNAAGSNIQAARSPDLVHWELLPDALPVLPAWATAGNTWAPEVTTTAEGKQYVMYFVANLAPGQRQCIGVATSASPEGPFRPSGQQPFICQLDRGGSIDPSSFVDDDGARYVLWKNDGNCCGGQTWLFIQKVSDDGLTLEGAPTELITADQVWEGVLVEAPTLWKHAGKYYLFYSANDYSSPRYAVGYAVADSVLGPYRKARRPLLATSVKDGVVGPGGQDIVAKDGATWILYHSWEPQSFRSMSIDRLVWQGDVPLVQGPNRSPEPLP